MTAKLARISLKGDPLRYIHMAKTKAAGSTRLGRDSAAKRLGVKLFAGERAVAGAILIRQRGTKFLPGTNVRRGADDTLYAATPGIVSFTKIKRRRFDGGRRLATVVHIKAQRVSEVS